MVGAMTSTPDSPAHNGEDLAKLREEIDELKSHSTQELTDPSFGDLEGQQQLQAGPTDAVGSEFESNEARRKRHEKEQRRSQDGH
jgi:hypothetical protein